MVWSYFNLLGSGLAQSQKKWGRSRGKNTSVLKSAVVSNQPGEREREGVVRQRKKSMKIVEKKKTRKEKESREKQMRKK